MKTPSVQIRRPDCAHYASSSPVSTVMKSRISSQPTLLQNTLGNGKWSKAL
jgi:hypothetical protein